MGGDPPRDRTLDLPDDCLAIVFHLLGAGDRKSCSLVCRRWLEVEAHSRRRLALDARSSLIEALPSLIDRFDAVSSLSLRCDRRSDSIGDDALELIARSWPSLTRIKLRACRRVTDLGMDVLADGCPSLRRLSCASCSFGAAGLDAILQGCPRLEDLSIKRLRGLSNPPHQVVRLAVASSALRSICLKELYNGQCFDPLIAGSPNLRILKIIRCTGVWDSLLEVIAVKVPHIAEIHLEKIQVSDQGLFALSSCLGLEVLRLVKTPECTDAGVIAIANKCRHLRKIHIDGWRMNRIGDYGLMAIAKGCPELQELVLIGVNPTVQSVELIASSCRDLERLALCGCETIGDAEVACIATKCTAMRKLCIKGCPVTDCGLEALAEGCPNLIKIKLKRCNGVTREGLDWLLAARGAPFVVIWDAIELQELDASTSENGMPESVNEEASSLTEQIMTLDLPSSSNDRSSLIKSRMRSILASAVRNLSSAGDDSHLREAGV
ncbi:F-box protein At1g47056-like [Zingiber officinale]|uniref:F-box domain-containing protein n=1 Tax=Zingiber officinale TaxID=94328 RepID=A0A8J5FXP7_ZINOF|nr:F-box protein At1g47056-like [Zingiber officinale]KAG6492387.1 hypothetical protein ZIOFF_047350 [Zingiber officinale]